MPLNIPASNTAMKKGRIMRKNKRETPSVRSSRKPLLNFSWVADRGMGNSGEW